MKIFGFLRSGGARSYPGLASAPVYAVGDIHGRADLLASLFRRIDRDVGRSGGVASCEVYLGDFIDRGPDSRSVISLLIERSRRRSVRFLRGNHECLFMRAMAGSLSLHDWSSWIKFGGLTTVASYGVDVAPLRGGRLTASAIDDAGRALASAVPAEHREFLAATLSSWSCEDYFFVHAGVRPGVLLNDQDDKDLLWIRDGFVNSKADFGKIVVHGHTIAADPVFLPNRIGIDTGAYATNRLSCLRIDGFGPVVLED